MKILLNHFIGRRKGVFYSSVILTSLVLLVQWQFYSSSQTKLTADATENNIQSLGTSNRLILGGDDNSTSFLNSNETCILATTNMMPSPPLSTVDVSTSVPILIEPQPELYQTIERFSAEDKLLRMNTTFKRILFWNENNKNKNYGVGHGRDVLKKLGCPVWQCETSANRTDVHTYDAILFHLRTWSKNDLPHPRLANQRYVLWSMESAAWRIYSVAPMAEFFNWTMTYRWDSDVIAPYGYVRPIGNVPLHPSEAQMKIYLSNHRKSSSRNYAKGKTKMVVWFASNCRIVVSSRNELVKELQKYIAIDVYGTCGNLTCPKKLDDSYESSEECRDLAASEHKFYLSLENSLCRDYVTEKLFAMMHRPIIPVVYGLHDDQEKLAPPHSFINAAKFENTKALADYLILLNNNDTLYNEYFWWKPYFQVHDSEHEKKKSMCRLCAALHDETLPPKIYHNLTDWWDTQSACIFSPKIS